MVRIVHGADFHLDSAFAALSPEKASLRRREQRATVKRVFELAERENADMVLLSGDLFDGDCVYFDTLEMLREVFAAWAKPVFIAPGNHDPFNSSSPYALTDWSENVHIFPAGGITKVVLDDLNAVVYGAGFGSDECESMLRGFRAEDADRINIMVLHGDLGESKYASIDKADIAASGLDYLALGHIHMFSGILSEGGTVYAYPGCPEGRGFDETGDKGVIAGTVDKSGCSLRFESIGLRRCEVLRVSLDELGSDSLQLPSGHENDIYKVIVTGERDGEFPRARLEELFKDRFFHCVIRDETTLRRDIWTGMGDDTLRGRFLEIMSRSDDELRELAVRFATAAMDNREVPE